MLAAVPQDICPPCIAFHAVSGCVIDENLRAEFFANLKWCLEQSDAALGVLLLNDKLLAYAVDNSGQLVPDTADILLLTHLVANSPSLHSYSPSWIPVCLPGFNPAGYLQAYVSAIPLHSPYEAPSDGSARVDVIPSPSGGNVTAQSGRMDICGVSLILISTSTEEDQFRKLHEGRILLQEALGGKDTMLRLANAASLANRTLAGFSTPCSALHFFCRFRPSHRPLPAQCHWTPFSFPLDCLDSQQRVWSEYERMAVCLRFGASAPGITLLQQRGQSEQDKASNSTGKDVVLNPNTTSYESHPVPENGTAYSILESGLVLVSFASDFLELHATFPATLRALTACESAESLAKSLEADAHNLFQIEL